jgi:hypothetical protein
MRFAGVVLNLGKHKNKANGVFNKLTRFNIENTCLINQFDFIIDFRVKNNQFQIIDYKVFYTTPYIMTIHSYMTEYFPKWHFVKNL